MSNTDGYILAHDLGTSGNKATLFDTEGRLVCSANLAYDVWYPRERFVEQDPRDWWDAVCATTRAIIEKAGVLPAQILCVSFSAQMMGCLLVDSRGEPLRPMITWADTRSEAQEQRMVAGVGAEKGYRITGHRLSASYSAAKLMWIMDNEPDLYGKAYRMLHAKDYIIHKLTGTFLTDYSDASGTNLLDINKKKWSDELIRAFELRADLMPELHASTDIAGTVTAQAARECGLTQGTPVVVGGGDGSCACVGAGAVEEGRAYNVIGTSSWISFAAREPFFDDEMRTFNWVHLNPDLYTPCGTMQAAGLSYQWYRNTLCGGEMREAFELGHGVYELLDSQAASVPAGSSGVLFLPYLLGERSPLWNLDARGAFVGLQGATGKAEMTRAVLEGVGFNLRVILNIFRKNAHLPEIAVIGGGAKGRVWLQILADIWQIRLLVPRYLEEATSMGAAICAGVGIGMFKDFASCRALNETVDIINPNEKTARIYDEAFENFQLAYHQLVPVFAKLAHRGY